MVNTNVTHDDDEGEGAPPTTTTATNANNDADVLAVESDSRWQTIVKRVSQAVVVIKTTGVRSFDTESAGSAYATGFVVDKALGLILTNRHVLRPGPVVAEVGRSGLLVLGLIPPRPFRSIASPPKGDLRRLKA